MKLVAVLALVAAGVALAHQGSGLLATLKTAWAAREAASVGASVAGQLRRDSVLFDQLAAQALARQTQTAAAKQRSRDALRQATAASPAAQAWADEPLPPAVLECLRDPPRNGLCPPGGVPRAAPSAAAALPQNHAGR